MLYFQVDEVLIYNKIFLSLEKNLIYLWLDNKVVMPEFWAFFIKFQKYRFEAGSMPDVGLNFKFQIKVLIYA